jgi:hypothetical protein
VRSAIARHLGSRQVARVTYGTIIGLALVVALEPHPPAAGVMVATILATGLAVGLAELYSEVLGTETRTRRPVGRRDVRHIAGEVGAVMFGIAFPAVFFAGAAAGAIEVETAFTVATWSGLGLIGFYGFWGARLAGRSVTMSVLHALAVAVIGGVLIAVKAVLH